MKGRLWMVAVLLAACSMPLVRYAPPDRPRWDVPYGKPFPEGTRGMAVVRDTLWVGDLQALPNGIRLAGRTFRLEEVDCLSYRLPANYFPWQIGLQALMFGVAGTALTIAALTGSCACDVEPEFVSDTLDPYALPVAFTVGMFMGLACAIGKAICAGLKASAVTLGMSYVVLGTIYPRLRLREHLYRYTLHQDPLWQERCAALLHFYEPLLAEDSLTLLLRQGKTGKAIPLGF